MGPDVDPKWIKNDFGPFWAWSWPVGFLSRRALPFFGWALCRHHMGVFLLLSCQCPPRPGIYVRVQAHNRAASSCRPRPGCRWLLPGRRPCCCAHAYGAQHMPIAWTRNRHIAGRHGRMHICACIYAYECLCVLMRAYACACMLMHAYACVCMRMHAYA